MGYAAAKISGFGTTAASAIDVDISTEPILVHGIYVIGWSANTVVTFNHSDGTTPYFSVTTNSGGNFTSIKIKWIADNGLNITSEASGLFSGTIMYSQAGR